MKHLLSHEAIEQARSFNEIAKNIFAPLYPVLAQQILSRTTIQSGVCLDLGSGSASLGMALCQKTGLVTYALDHSLAMLQLAKENITANSLTGQLIPILGDVHSLPFPKHSIDLIVSRGSIFFWDDLPKVFQDIARVLKPGGYAYIGGGFGSQELFESIRKQMEAYEDWETKVRQRMASDNIEDMKKSLQKAQIQDAEIKDDETGFWIIVKQSETSSA